MKPNISKKKLEKIRDEIKRGLEKRKVGTFSTIEDNCDKEFWDDSPNIFIYLIKVFLVVRAIVSYKIMSFDEDINDKMKVIRGFQIEYSKDLNNIRLNDLNDRQLDNLASYYDSVAVLRLLIDGELDLTLLKNASQAFILYDKISKDKTEEYSYYEDRLAAELIRRTILGEFNYVINQSEKSMDIQLFQVDENASRQAIKVCYVLSKVGSATDKKLAKSDADTMMTIFKTRWLDQYRPRGVTTCLEEENVFLLQYALEKIQNRFTGDVHKMLNSFRPDVVFEETMKFVNKSMIFAEK